MIYYLLVLALVGVGVPLLYKNTMPRRLLYTGFSAIALSAVMGFRFLTGWDYGAYAKIYINLGMMNMDELAHDALEKGYLLLQRPFTFFSIDLRLGHWVTTIFTIALVTLYIYKHCKNLWFATFGFVAFGFLFNGMNLQRQFIAMLIGMWAWDYVKERNFLKYTVVILLASTFHISALLLLPCYILFLIPYNKIWAALYGGATIIFYTVLFRYVLLGFGLIFYLSGRMTTDSSDMMATIEKYIASSGELSNGVPFQYYITTVILFILSSIFHKQLLQRDKLNNTMLHALGLAMFFAVLGTQAAYVSRFALLFMMPCMLVLGDNVLDILLQKIPEDSKRCKLYRFGIYAITIVVMLLVFQYMHTHNYNGVVPYQNNITWN